MLNELRKATVYEIMNYPYSNFSSFRLKLKNTLRRILYKQKIDRYFWPNGLLAIGLQRDHINNKNEESLDALKRYIDSWINNGFKINNLDNVLSGYSLLYVYEVTKDNKYLKSINKLKDYILQHSVNEIGSFPYRENSLNVFADAIGMVPAFLCKLGNLTNDKKLIDLGVLQIINFMAHGMSSDDFLPYHCFNYEENVKKGIIGWGRAVGWIMIGISDSLEYIPKEHFDYDRIVNDFSILVDKCIKFQNDKGYFNWQLSTIDGPVDTSTTSMIIYSIDRGIELNILKEEYFEIVINGISALSSSFKNGYIFDCSAECLGLGLYPQKYSQYPWSLGLTLSLFSKYQK